MQQTAETLYQKHLVLILYVGFSQTLKNNNYKDLISQWVINRNFKTNYLESHLFRYKSFIRSYLDYGDVIYHQFFNSFFHQKLESVLRNAALALTSAIERTPREKVCQE